MRYVVIHNFEWAAHKTWKYRGKKEEHQLVLSQRIVPSATMEFTITALPIALATTSVFIFIFLRLRKWNDDLYPPVVGTVFSQIMNFHRLHDYMADHAHRYPTFRVLYPSFSYVYTAHPPNIEHILKTNFTNYVKGNFMHDIMEDLLGDGIFTVDGDQWRQQRKVASFEFSTKVLRDFSSVVFRDTAIRLANILAEAATTNPILEMQDLLLRSTLDGICKLAFGVDIDSLSSLHSGPAVSFAKAFDSANAIVLWRYVDSLWRLKRFFNVGSEAILKENIRIVNSFVYKVIQSRRQEMSAQNTHVKPDILSRFIALGKKEPKTFSDKYLRDVILNFMIAGRDTTAVTLCWFLHLLSNHPHAEQKLVEEICSLVHASESMPLAESITAFAQSLTHSVLDKMHYLHASLSETLRLYPAVPVDVKYIVSDDKLPDGFKMRAGDKVNYMPYAMGRMTYLWGSDASEFRPERWLQGGVFQPQSPFKFTAFQGGPRICLGKDFAYTQMKIVSAVLIRFFKFEVVRGKEVKYRPSLTLHMNEDGLNLHVHPRFDC